MTHPGPSTSPPSPGRPGSPAGPSLAEETDYPPTPVRWPFLTDAEAAAEADRLQCWVDWLVARYQLDARTVPPCWMQHGALVEELSSLRTAWLEAHDPSSDGGAPLDWHHAFHLARQRLTDWTARSGCRPGEHRVPR